MCYFISTENLRKRKFQMNPIIKNGNESIIPAKKSSLKFITNAINSFNFNSWKKSGEGLIYVEKETEWEKFFLSHIYNGFYSHGTLKTTLEFMKKIQDTKNYVPLFKEIDKIKDDVIRLDVLKGILYYSKIGPEFFESYYDQKFDEKRYPNIDVANQARRLNPKYPQISSSNSTENIIWGLKTANAGYKKKEQERNKLKKAELSKGME